MPIAHPTVSGLAYTPLEQPTSLNTAQPTSFGPTMTCRAPISSSLAHRRVTQGFLLGATFMSLPLYTKTLAPDIVLSKPLVPSDTSPPQSSTQINSPKWTHSFPPPQYSHVEPRANPKKTLISNSSKIIPFVIQRKIAKFPQTQLIQLVTLFSVCLRVLPFSEPSLEIQAPKSATNPDQTAQIPLIPHGPLIRDPMLILFSPWPVLT
jgi:hypothetical protein